LDRVVEIKL